VEYQAMNQADLVRRFFRAASRYSNPLWPDDVALAGNVMTKEANNSPDFARMSCGRDAVFRHFHFGDASEREEQLDQIFRGIFGSLAQDMADGSGDGSVEQDVSGLHSGEIHAHCLSWLKGSHDSPRIKLWASRPPNANL
jgi:hypothetical protein